MDLSELGNLRYGQRVRISFEGEFRQRIPGGAIFKIPVPAGDDTLAESFLALPAEGASMTVEVIEPEYVDGAAYIDADGVIFTYQAPERDGWQSHWIVAGLRGSWPYGVPVRPVTRLVPEAVPNEALQETLDTLRRKLSGNA